MIDENADLHSVLPSRDPPGRDALRRVLIRDQADRDEDSMQLPRYRDAVGDELADIIDMLDDEPRGAEEGRKTARRD